MTTAARVLAAVILSLGAYTVEAAGKYDGSTPLLCVPISVTECETDGECRRVTAARVNLPQFLRVDVKGMKIRDQETGRESPIKNVERANGRVILQGAQGERGWTLTIADDTGKMSATVSADGEGFIIFGACTLP